MGTKGEKTKHFICEAAFRLFAEKGFKDVTMKDICEKTGLSRGGLYRHYDSTSQIFLELIHTLMADQQNEFEEKIKAKVPAREILLHVLNRYETEMLDREHSLSIAIYEFFSGPSVSNSSSMRPLRRCGLPSSVTGYRQVSSLRSARKRSMT